MGDVTPHGVRWEQVLAFRLRRQRLARRIGRDAMLQVAADLCGLHAQVMSSAELTLWARVDELRPGDVARELWDERRLVKTWAMRGTLHLLPASDVPVWQAGLSSFRHYLAPSWLKNFGVSAVELDQMLASIPVALDGRLLTRQELASEVARLTGSVNLGQKLGHSWGALLKPASYRGLLCFGPSQGQNVRFTRPDQWLADWRPADSDEAWREVGRRYLGGFGPAPAQDFARWWGGVSSARASRLFQSLGAEAASVEVDGVRMWLLSSQLDELEVPPPPRCVRLLPAFDQYVIGAPRGADHVIAPAFRSRVYRNQGWISPVLLVDGRMEGVWRHERKGSRLSVTIEPFSDQPASVRSGAEAEAERLAAYLGGKLELIWTG